MLAKNLTVSGAAARLYSDDVFQAYTRTGTGADVTVTTNIDMTQGYMLWSKGRSGATYHAIYDSLRGVTKDLVSNSAAAETTQSTGLKSVTSTSHTVGSLAKMNTSSATYVDFVFRKAAKFFDVVTYTGNGSNRTISHSLGQVPGMIIVKATNAATDWQVYHRGLTSANYKLVLNTIAAETPSSVTWNATAPTATEFSVGTHTEINNTGDTYVAYLFAHDTGADGLIQCGSFTTDGSGNATVTLGWEPQYLLLKGAVSATNWWIRDVARNLTATETSAGPYGSALYANTSDAESATSYAINPTATGFSVKGFAASQAHVYLAIRRPNKPPTVGTQVYNAIARTGTGAAATVTGVGFAPDSVILAARPSGGGYSATAYWHDRLRGSTNTLTSTSTAVESAVSTSVTSLDMSGMSVGSAGNCNTSAVDYVNHFFKRAPGVFDIVCYTGTGGATTIAHSLGAVPELMIVKGRSLGGYNWGVWHTDFGTTDYIILDSASAKNGFNLFNTVPTSSVFGLGSDASINGNTNTYVWYGFATKAGISKVGSYTGTGTTNAIDCDFTTGARFILIKRTDSTGGWYVWDTVRGIIAGNDPYLLLNSTATEVISTDYIDPSTAGFELSSTAPAAINANGGTFIYLAFA